MLLHVHDDRDGDDRGGYGCGGYGCGGHGRDGHDRDDHGLHCLRHDPIENILHQIQLNNVHHNLFQMVLNS